METPVEKARKVLEQGIEGNAITPLLNLRRLEPSWTLDKLDQYYMYHVEEIYMTFQLSCHTCRPEGIKAFSPEDNGPGN